MKSSSKRFSEVIIAVTAAVFGLLVQPTISSITDPLFDTPIKALLTGFSLLAFILILTIIVVTIFVRQHDTQLNRFEKNLLETKSQVRLSTSLAEVGISGAVPKHTETMLDEICSSPDNELRILQTYFGSLHALPTSIFMAAKRGVKVRILILDPKSDIIRRRLRDVGLPDTVQVHTDAIERLKILIKRHKPPSDSFEIRLYNRIPPFAMYKADSEIRLGFFWHGEHCPSGPHIYVDNSESILGKFAINTFNDIWRSAEIANLNT